MARLMIVVLFLAVVAGVALGVMASVGRAAQAGRAQLARTDWARADWERGNMQRLSGIVLLALILYVSFWGGA